MISVVSTHRGARIVTNGNVSQIIEPATGTVLSCATGKDLTEAHIKAFLKADKIHGTETAIAKRLAERFLV